MPRPAPSAGEDKPRRDDERRAVDLGPKAAQPRLRAVNPLVAGFRVKPQAVRQPRHEAERKVAPDALMCETPARLDMMCEAAAVELGKELVPDEARLRADYDLTLREITRRLKSEKEAAR